MRDQVKGENPVKIVRWNKVVILPSGETGYMCCRYGPTDQVREWAEQIAKENGATVEAII